MKKFFLTGLASCLLISSFAQADRWQQGVDYTMEIDFNDSKNQFSGKQKLTYINNSPDTLDRVFYHLYFNAFQPGSMMDVRSRTITDPDRRVEDRISKLNENEIGYHHIDSLTQNGKVVQYHTEGTVLEVELAEPILPNSSANFYMEFNSQVPVQIRRSGRHSKEGIDYTMTQWYPKMAEYDYEGWHANPYVGREFYGVWGNFDVTIRIPEKYVLGGTGEQTTPTVENGIKTWHFNAKNVHDFAWAADPDYKHDTQQVPGGPLLHFYYQSDSLDQKWKEIQPEVVRLFEIMSSQFGQYPYSQFSVIQGGDGGMEYPMCTMILGRGGKEGTIGLIAHESFHNWYYGLLGSNEFKYPWMDEGFTTYAEEMIMDSLLATHKHNPLEGSYRAYRYMAKSDWEESMATPADFFKTNRAYGINSYSKGSITVHQLAYIVGDDVLMRSMKRYFDLWKFKHPNPNDFKRIVEKESGLELDWYFEHWVNTVNHIDYAIESVEKDKKKTKVNLKRIGFMPMPLDIVVTLKDGTQKTYYIPLGIMRGEKAPENSMERIILADWPWTHPTNTIELDVPMKKIKSIAIDPSLRMADIELQNNIYPAPKEKKEKTK